MDFKLSNMTIVQHCAIVLHIKREIQVNKSCDVSSVSLRVTEWAKCCLCSSLYIVGSDSLVYFHTSTHYILL